MHAASNHEHHEQDAPQHVFLSPQTFFFSPEGDTSWGSDQFVGVGYVNA